MPLQVSLMIGFNTSVISSPSCSVPVIVASTSVLVMSYFWLMGLSITNCASSESNASFSYSSGRLNLVGSSTLESLRSSSKTWLSTVKTGLGTSMMAFIGWCVAFALLLGLRLDELYDLDKFFNNHSIPDGSAIHGKRNCFRLLGADVDMSLVVGK